MFNLHKTLLVSTSVLGLLTHSSFAMAQETAQEEWTPRTVEQVKEDLIVEGNKLTYTVKFGDTLSVIADAMGIDMHHLAQINDIANAGLIVEGTILTVWLNADQEIESIQVQSPDGQVQEFPVEVAHEEVVTSQEPAHLAIFTPEVQTIIEPVDEWNAQAPQTGTQVTNKPVVEETPQVELEVPQVEVTPQESVQPEVDQVVPESSLEVEQQEAPETTVKPEEVPQVEATPQETVQPEVNEIVPESSLEVEQQTDPEASTESQEDEDVEYEESMLEDVEEQIEAESTLDEEDIVTSDPAPEVEQTYTPDPNDPSNHGLKPQVMQFKEEVAQQYDVNQFSGYRPGDPQDHGQGLAIDFMVYEDAAKGDAIADYSTANMADNNISYVIWKQQIYGDWNHAWKPMEDRGSITENHYDHVHVSFHQ